MGLRLGGSGSVAIDSSSLLVKPEVARVQIEAEEAEREARERARREAAGRTDGVPLGGTEPQAGITYDPPPERGNGRVSEPPRTEPQLPRRFYASVTLDPDRVGRDAGKIADEVLSHLSALPGTRLRVSIEIEADMSDGAPEHVQRTISENARVLKFDSHGFEQE